MKPKQKRNLDKVQMMIEAGLIVPDLGKLIELTGLNKRTVYNWILEDNKNLISKEYTAFIESKIKEYAESKKEKTDNEALSRANQKISEALDF